jgi:2-hydroxychromene-2-carboxylate isomerase
LFEAPVPATWHWRPISIDILLNLQACREPLAAYIDPLAAPKRRHLLADVRRCAEMYRAPLKPPQQPRPNPQSALCISLLLRKRGIANENFRNAVFDAYWKDQRDVGAPAVLKDCLSDTDVALDIIDEASSSVARAELIADTQRAYEFGVFGVPTFALGDEIFFGNDRLEMVRWRLTNQIPNVG